MVIMGELNAPTIKHHTCINLHIKIPTKDEPEITTASVWLGRSAPCCAADQWNGQDGTWKVKAMDDGHVAAQGP